MNVVGILVGYGRCNEMTATSFERLYTLQTNVPSVKRDTAQPIETRKAIARELRDESVSEAT